MATRTTSQMTEDMTAAAEQVRKTAAAATEQARQTVSAAQDQLHQSLSQAQQVQGDLAQMMVRISEQNSKLVGAAFTGFWDASLSMLTMAAWGQDQVERSARQLMDQGHISRDEGATMIREAGERVRQQQAELYRLAQEQLTATLDAARYTGVGTDKATGGHGKSAAH